MAEYTFYRESLMKVMSTLQVTHRSCAQMLGMSDSSWQYKLHHDTLSCTEMLQLCNGLHVPLACFISINGKTPLMQFVPADQWKPVSHDIQNFIPYMLTEYPSVYALSEKLNIFTNTLYDYLLPDVVVADKMTFRRFLAWCSTMQINIDSFLTDTNMALPCIEGFHTRLSYAELLVLYRNAIQDNATLQQKNERMLQQLQEIAVRSHAYYPPLEATAKVKKPAKGAYKDKIQELTNVPESKAAEAES